MIASVAYELQEKIAAPDSGLSTAQRHGLKKHKARLLKTHRHLITDLRFQVVYYLAMTCCVVRMLRTEVLSRIKRKDSVLARKTTQALVSKLRSLFLC